MRGTNQSTASGNPLFGAKVRTNMKVVELTPEEVEMAQHKLAGGSIVNMGQYGKVEMHWLDSKGRKHRANGPAVESDTRKEYWVEGLMHREDGPAVEMPGQKEYWVKGKLHREDGPALETDELKEYWIKGKLHREDGPAVKMPGRKEYWVKGKLHRDDAPAIVEEYLDGSGSERWYQKGKLHRDGDDPAWFHYNADGTINEELMTVWAKNDKKHRDGDLPAETWAGKEIWFKNGKRHRDNNKPSEVRDGQGVEWRVDGKKHRLDGPAVVHTRNESGQIFVIEEYWVEGKLHKLDGPVKITGDKGTFYIDGKHIKPADYGKAVKEFLERT